MRARKTLELLRGRRFSTLVLVGLLAGGIAACGERPGFGYGIGVENRTHVVLHFGVIKSDGTELALAGQEVAPGDQDAILTGGLLDPSEKIVANWCTVGDLIAYGPDNREIARHPPGLCADRSDRWVVTEAQPSPLGSGPSSGP